jgi:MFS family permease
MSIALLALAGVIANPVLPYLFSACFGLCNGIALPAFMAAVADLFQGRHFGSILGVTTLGGYFGAAMGAWLSGYLFDLTGAYKLGFLTAAVGMCLTAILIWKVRPGRIRFIRAVEAG